MSGVNTVILIGNVGADPETKTFADGNSITTLSLATSETWKDKATGEKQERTEWHRVVFRGGLAGVVDQYVRKGSQIYVQGKLQTRKWQGQDGGDRYSTDVVVGMGGTMQMLGGRGTAETGQRSTQGAQTPSRASQGASEASRGGGRPGDGFEPVSDIPFQCYLKGSVA